MVLCTNCGRPRYEEAPTRRCACIPDGVWKDPEMITAVEHIDLGAVMRLLRRHPMTRHLSQTALSRLTGASQSTISRWESSNKIPHPHRAVQAFKGLGVPGVPWGGRWLLPEERTNDTAPESAASKTTPAPCVTITAPGPIDVQVMQPTEDGDDPVGVIALVTDKKGPRLVVAPDSTWGVTNSPTGSTAWFALNMNECSSLTAHEST